MEERRARTRIKETINCLLIEDDASDRTILERFIQLNELNYMFFHAETIAEASGLLETKRIHVIISDISFRDGDISMLFRHAKYIPLICVTSEGEEEIAAKILKMGASDYIIKDMKRNYLQLLPHAIEKALREKRVAIIGDSLLDSLKETGLAICIFDAAGEILFASQRFREDFDLVDENLLLNVKKLLINVLPNDVVPVGEDFEPGNYIGEGVRFQVRLKGKDAGETVKLTTVKDHNNDIVGYVWMEQRERRCDEKRCDEKRCDEKNVN